MATFLFMAHSGRKRLGHRISRCRSTPTRQGLSIGTKIMPVACLVHEMLIGHTYTLRTYPCFILTGFRLSSIPLISDLIHYIASTHSDPPHSYHYFQCSESNSALQNVERHSRSHRSDCCQSITKKPGGVGVYSS